MFPTGDTLTSALDCLAMNPAVVEKLRSEELHVVDEKAFDPENALYHFTINRTKTKRYCNLFMKDS